jgi:hypothetical protein
MSIISKLTQTIKDAPDTHILYFNPKTDALELFVQKATSSFCCFSAEEGPSKKVNEKTWQVIKSWLPKNISIEDLGVDQKEAPTAGMYRRLINKVAAIMVFQVPVKPRGEEETKEDRELMRILENNDQDVAPETPLSSPSRNSKSSESPNSHSRSRSRSRQRNQKRTPSPSYSPAPQSYFVSIAAPYSPSRRNMTRKSPSMESIPEKSREVSLSQQRPVEGSASR